MAESQRTSRELVDELNEAAEPGEFAALAVAFNEDTSFVWSGNPRAHEQLNAMIEQGGEPVGLFFRDEDGFHARVLQEYRDEEWAEKLVIGLLARVRDLARAGGYDVGEVKGREP